MFCRGGVNFSGPRPDFLPFSPLMRLSAPGPPVAPASPCHAVNALPYRAPCGKPVFTGAVDGGESIGGIINDTSGGRSFF